jgi:hypothetical protein
MDNMRTCRAGLASFLRKGRMQTSVTAKHQGVARPSFFPQLVQAKIGDSICWLSTAQHQPYLINLGGLPRPASPAIGWTSAGQPGHSGSGVAKYHD